MFSLMNFLDDDYPRYRVPAGLLLPSLLDSHSPRVHYHLSVPRRQQRSPATAESSSNDADFQVMLNAKHFRPDEIEVKVVDDHVVIHGRHEEQADEHGFVSREFTRRYRLPSDVEPDAVTSHFGRNGVLTVRAPRKPLQPPPANERVVPITIQQPAAVEQQEAAATAQQQQQSAEDKME